MTQKFITSAQLGAKFGLQRGTIEHWRTRGYGPAYVRQRGRVYYDEDVVAAWLAANTHHSTAEYDAPTAAAAANAAAIANAQRQERAAQPA